MTSVVKIYGASDDLIEVEGAISDEFSLPPSGHWLGKLTSPDGAGIILSAVYCGTWILGAGPLDQGVPLPHWDISVQDAEDNNYSSMLVIVSGQPLSLRECGPSRD